MDEEVYRRRMVDGKTGGAFFALKAKRDERDGMGSVWEENGMGSGWKVDGKWMEERWDERWDGKFLYK